MAARKQNNFQKSQIWYVTTVCDGLTSPAPHSAVTLDALRLDHPTDFADYNYARETWQSHRHWFTGLGFRVYTPLTVIVIQDCLTPTGLLQKSIRPLVQRIGGRWEITRNGKDVQGFVMYPDKIQFRGGMFQDYRVSVCGDGLCAITCKVITGFSGDPAAVDYEAIDTLLSEIRRTPWPSVPAQPPSPKSPLKQQLSLFEDDT